MRIGLDFDNTIVNYNNLFFNVARDLNWIPQSTVPSKSAVKSAMLSQNMEQDWIALQGLVYGKFMGDAELFTGFYEFLDMANANGIVIEIISHRSKFPYSGEMFNLHDAATNFIINKIFSKSSQRFEFNFHEHKFEKIECIKIKKCDYFLDDLPSILQDISFPHGCVGILFDPFKVAEPGQFHNRVFSWKNFANFILDRI